MDIINILATQPTGVWETIISWFESFAGTYILAIILLTICIRLLWAPFDFFNRRMSKKNASVQSKLQPEIKKLEKKYGNDKNLYNQKVSELYKKSQSGMMGSCVFMLIFMGLNMFIFFTLFSGLNSMAQFKITQQYEDLKYTYANELYIEINGVTREGYELQDFSNQAIKDMLEDANYQIAHEEAIKEVNKVYLETQESFLWIGNIWKADAPWTSNVPTFDEYASRAKLTDEEATEERVIYEAFMNTVREDVGRPNGYLLCVMLAAGTALLSSWLMNFNKRKKGEVKPEGQAGATNKMMMILMPALMGVFAIFTNSVFAIYMIISQVVSAALTPLYNVIINKLDKRKEGKKKENEVVVEYSRKK